LKHDMPTLEYEAHKELFDILTFEENLKVHWIDLASWAMVQHMDNMVLEVTITTIIASYYIL
jgi:hypothetical protein